MQLSKTVTVLWRPQSRSLSAMLLGLVVLLALWYQVKLLDYVEWGDESETIIAARMLASGMQLYSEVFNHHGPLVFLSGYLLELAGHFSVASHRVPIAVLQWMAIFAVYRSPLFSENPDKHIFLAIIITAMISLLPGHQLYGHAYIYQVIAGLMVVIIAAHYTLPAIADAKQLSHARVATGSILIACLPFLAITYLPAAALLFLCSLRRASLRWTLACTLAGLICNVAFLGLIGSFKGYMAYHIYLNAQILPLYNGGQGIARLIKNMLSMILATAPIESFLSFMGLFIGFAAVADLEKARFPWRSTLLAVAIATLLLRGVEFHGAAFWYAYIGVMALCLAQLHLTQKQQLIWQILVLFCVFRLAYPTLVGDDLLSEKRKESTTFGELAKAITNKDDRVIAYSFQNFEYLSADRLPASGDFFYLPWQEKYNESPRFGIRINACDDIKRTQPKLMLIDKWMVFGKYPWDSYAGCVQGVLDARYRQIPNELIFVRSDYYDRAVAFLALKKKSSLRSASLDAH